MSAELEAQLKTAGGMIQALTERADALVAALAAAEKRERELLEALKPFAECADCIPNGWFDDHGLGDWALGLDVGDLRRAREVSK